MRASDDPQDAAAISAPWPALPQSTGSHIGSGLPPEPDWSAGSSSPDDSGLTPPKHLGRWMGWRLRLLVCAALLGCLGIFLLPQLLSGLEHIDGRWALDVQSRVRLVSSGDPKLRMLEGQVLTEIRGDGLAIPVDSLLLEKSARWLTGAGDRQHYLEARQILKTILAADRVSLIFGNGTEVDIEPHSSRITELGSTFWLFSGMALLLYLLAMVVSLAAPSVSTFLYATIALCQTGNLICIAIESTVSLGSLGRFDNWDAHLRMTFDLVASAAAVHAVTLRPHKLPASAWLAAAAWAFVAALCYSIISGYIQSAWWWTQAGCAALGSLVVILLSWSYRLEPNPMAIVLRRLLMVAAAVWLLLTIAVAVTDDAPGMQRGIASVGSMIWYVFLASLLALVPFLGQSRLILREFSLLAAISTVATSLDLLFVALFSLSQFASLTLSLFLSVGVYVGVRQWLLSHVRGRNMITTERMFEQLYRTARAVEARPHQSAALLAQLLREVFEPLEVSLNGAPSGSSRVEGDGSTLRVNVPALSAEAGRDAGSIVIRYAQRGRRLFTLEDARLTDRIVDQLRRAVAFDRAVEHGRSEERARLAQDLHDDIGARLLTLMYKSSSQEMEDYIRHTLQDLKTLTRGLAAPSHRLSHASAEWKADLTQRLSAARISLDLRMQTDDDILLSVVQWSALTRILRELVSNVISHAQATHVDIELRFSTDHLELTVIDNGVGQNPKAWAHGLGLGGVRKRARQLGGDVEWTQHEGHGIRCRVTIRQAWQRP